MASQVLSGSSNPSYTNNTGQNVRVVINYMNMRRTNAGNINLTINWAGVSVSYSTTGNETNILTIGRNLACVNTVIGLESVNVPGPKAIAAQNMYTNMNDDFNLPAFPTELILAPGQTFSAICGVYNIVVIPEAG